MLANDIDRVHDCIRNADGLLFAERTKDAADREQTCDAANELLRAAAGANLLTGDIDVAVAVKVATQHTGDELLVRMVNDGANELIIRARTAEL